MLGMVWYIPSRSSLDAWLQARLGGLQALVDASVCRSARCAGALGVPEACRLGAPLVVGAVEVAAPLLTAFSSRFFAPGSAL
jgi:hypothetical protein